MEYPTLEKYNFWYIYTNTCFLCEKAFVTKLEILPTNKPQVDHLDQELGRMLSPMIWLKYEMTSSLDNKLDHSGKCFGPRKLILWAPIIELSHLLSYELITLVEYFGLMIRLKHKLITLIRSHIEFLGKMISLKYKVIISFKN